MIENYTNNPAGTLSGKETKTSTSEEEHPLITFALFAYNQEQFIREAVEGALSQTYSPLEIILSDDCSTDGTFEIMKGMVRKYEGSHKIVIRKNKKNLGLCAHFNTVTSLSKGELIILGAGDDVSVPNRAKMIVNEWLRNKQPSLIVSDFFEISNLGNVLPKKLFYSKRDFKSHILEPVGVKTALNFLKGESEFRAVGATQAVSKKLTEVFGSIDMNVNNEDTVNYFRATLYGGRLYIKEKLVHYRVHEKSISNGIKSRVKAEGIRESYHKYKKYNDFIIPAYYQLLRDVELALLKGIIERAESKVLKEKICCNIRISEAIAGWDSMSVARRVHVYYRDFKKIGNKTQCMWARKRLLGIKALDMYLKVKILLRKLGMKIGGSKS